MEHPFCGIGGQLPPSIGLSDSVGVDGAGASGEGVGLVKGVDSVPHPQISVTKAGKKEH